jgi:small-conductance mechanosensitive channel
MSSEFNISNIFSELKDKAYQYMPKIAISIFIIIIFAIVANLIYNLIIGPDDNIKKNVYSENSLASENNLINTNIVQKYRKNLIIRQLASIVYYSIFILGIMFALINIGFQTGSIFAVLGIFGLAFSISVQNTISNFMAGIYIAFSNIFKIGDRLKINTFTGTVTNFNLFNTELITDNNEILVVPNLLIQNTIILNNK